MKHRDEELAMVSRRLGCALMLAALACFAGCDVLGKGTQEAVYTLPKGARVLVFVDPRPGSDVPLDVPLELGQQLTDHLHKYKVADTFVSQQELLALRTDKDRIEKMAVQDVAVATNADLVLHVDMLSFAARSVSEGQLTEGAAQALVKVIDRNGNRLWPPGAEGPGASAYAVVGQKFAEEQDLSVVKRKLVNDLAVMIGRTFHQYDREDKYLAR